MDNLYRIPRARTVSPIFDTTLPAIAAPSKDSDTGPPSWYCYMRLYGPGTENPRPDTEGLISQLSKIG